MAFYTCQQLHSFATNLSDDGKAVLLVLDVWLTETVILALCDLLSSSCN